MDFEDFHIVSVKVTSDRFAELLRRAGARIQQRVANEAGRTEYVIAVHPDDVDLAGQVLAADVGPGRTFTAHGP
jgi:hypothetical protein